MTRVVQVPYVVEQDEDGVWCACAALGPGVAAFGDGQARMIGASGAPFTDSDFDPVPDCLDAHWAALGVTPLPILRGERGAPEWPPGFVGSITHCTGYRAAAVARASDVLTVGLDAEPDDSLPEGVLRLVSLPAEQTMVRHLATAVPGICWDRLLFSAKESVYKAWFPLTRRWLDFTDADIAIDPADGTFHAHLLIDSPVVGLRPPTDFTGRWLAEQGLILTAVTVSA